MKDLPHADLKAGQVTWLAVPLDAASYARRHGARWSARDRAWFVVGDVPPELVNYLPAEERSKVAAGPVQCPICSAPMFRRLNRQDGTYFWGCMRWPTFGCKGAVSLESTVDMGDSPIKSAADWLLGQVEAGRRPDSCLNGRELASREALTELLSAAILVLGSVEQTVKWLRMKKVGLGYKMPVECLGTADGRAAVLKLLDSIDC